jgi:protein TonB
MNAPNFERTMKRTAIAHGVVIGALVLWPLLYTLFVNRPRKQETIALIDLQVAMTTLKPQVAVPQNEPEPPKPDKPPEPKPLEPKPTEIPKEIKPVKTNTLVKASEIKVSTNRIKIAQNKPKPQDTGPKLTEAQIKALLAAGIPKGDFTSIPGGGSPDLFSAYYLMMRGVMYDAWQQPSGLAGSGLYATVKFRVLRDGSITERTMTRRSGNSLLDDSVLRAANSVRRLRPLPTAYQGNYKDITVDFELTGAF